MDLIPGSGRSPGGEHGNPLQYSCLENPMDIGAWQATVHGVAKSQTRLKCLCTHVGWGEEWGCSLAHGMPNSVLKWCRGLSGSLPQTSSLCWLRSVLDSCQAHIFLVSPPERKALIFLFFPILLPSLPSSCSHPFPVPFLSHHPKSQGGFLIAFLRTPFHLLGTAMVRL